MPSRHSRRQARRAVLFFSAWREECFNLLHSTLLEGGRARAGSLVAHWKKEKDKQLSERFLLVRPAAGNEGNAARHEGDGPPAGDGVAAALHCTSFVNPRNSLGEKHYVRKREREREREGSGYFGLMFCTCQIGIIISTYM